MKDHTRMSPLKRISLTFLTVTALGITSSWLSSCSDSKATSDPGSTAGDHTDIVTRLSRIETKIGNSSDVNSMIGLTSKLSDDIGLMAERILDMADKIVETEKLIVYVITNQSGKAGTVISGIKTIDRSKGGTAATGLPVFDATTLSKPSILSEILSGHSSQNGVQLIAGNNIPAATSTTAPNFSFAGMNQPAPAAGGGAPAATNPGAGGINNPGGGGINNPIGGGMPLQLQAGGIHAPYVLLVSMSPLFNNNPTSFTIDATTTVDTAWADMVSAHGLIPVNGTPSKVYYAVKTITNGKFSPMSNILIATITQ